MTDTYSMNKPTADHKLYGLDHLRALAITLVFFYHYRQFEHPDWIPKIGKFGWTGVDLFFVLSGYLIASQLFSKIVRGKEINLKEFFLKRFFRIIPAYLVVVAIYFCIPAFREKEALPPLWKFLTFTQNFGVDVRNAGTFSHAWSLCIEEQFYLLLPLTLAALVYFKVLNKGLLLLIFLFFIGFAVRYYSWQQLIAPHLNSKNFSPAWYRWIYYPTYNRLDGLLAGVSLAGVFQFWPALKNRLIKHGNLFIALSLVVLAIAYILSADAQTFRHTVFGFPAVAIGYGVMVLGAVSPSAFLYNFRFKITETVATLSYAIYLTHKGFIHLTQEYGSRLGIAPDSNIMFVLCICVAFVGALLLNRIVEKPFLKLRDRILQKKTTRPVRQLEVIKA